MTNLIKQIFSCETKSNEQFKNIMDFAKKMEESNPSQLFNLVRLLIKPLQTELLTSVIYSKPDESMKPMKSYEFFIPNANEKILELEMSINYPKLKNSDYLVQLKNDPILPCPWVKKRLIKSINSIGEGKSSGSWKQDISNHYVTIWQPFGIVFVENGNHSIAVGVIEGEGTLEPTSVYDMSELLNKVKCDGENYIDISSGEIIAKMEDVNIGAIFEIGRLIKKHNILPMHI